MPPVLRASSAASINVHVRLTDEVRRGFVTLPHGYGMIESFDLDKPTANAQGPEINKLSDSNHRDRIAGTPFHKWIPVSIAPAAEPARSERETVAAV